MSTSAFYLPIPPSIDAEVAAWVQERAEPTDLPVGAAVTVRDGRLRVLVDPVFWGALDDREREIVLKHELVHVLHGHVYESTLPSPRKETARRLAQHCVIDWSLGCPDVDSLDQKLRRRYHDLVESWLARPWANGSILDRWATVATWLGLDPTAPPPSVVRLAALIEERLPDEAGHDHGPECCQPGEPTPESEIDRVLLAKACAQSGDRDLAEAAHNVSPQGDEAYTPPRIAFQPDRHKGLAALLQAIRAASSSRRLKTETWMREGRFPLLPGVCKAERMKRVAVCVDTSGSVSDELVARFASVLAGTLGHRYEGMFSEFTEKVHVHGDRWHGRTQRGGTLFGPAMKWAASQRPDVVVMMTDGDAHDSGVPSVTAPIIWVLPPRRKVIGWAVRPRDRIVYMEA
jgi:hypothetical protein